MKSIVYLLLIVLFPLQAIGQNYIQKEKPFWADGYFREMDNSYIEVVNAFGYDLDSAKIKLSKKSLVVEVWLPVPKLQYPSIRMRFLLYLVDDN